MGVFQSNSEKFKYFCNIKVPKIGPGVLKFGTCVTRFGPRDKNKKKIKFFFCFFLRFFNVFTGLVPGLPSLVLGVLG